MADEWYAVRCVFQWTEAEGRPYEERITVWRAADFATALALAEAEAGEYAASSGVAYLGLAQSYATGGSPAVRQRGVLAAARQSAAAGAVPGPSFRHRLGAPERALSRPARLRGRGSVARSASAPARSRRRGPARPTGARPVSRRGRTGR